MFRRFAILLTSSLLLSLAALPLNADQLLIWDQLQGTSAKGYVLLLRHSLAPGVGDPDNFRLGDCSTQRNLSDIGRSDAREVGAWLKRLDIKIYRVESSRWCRAKETAELLGLGPVKLNKHLDSLFEEADARNHPKTALVRKQILDHRNRVGLLVLVGHFVNISALTGVGVASGEGILVRANRKGELKVLGVTPSLGR